MKKEILEKLKSLNKKLAEDELEGIALRLRSFYTWMKGSLRASEPGSLPHRFFLEEKRRQQVIAGYLTGTILVEMGVINSKQLAEAEKIVQEAAANIRAGAFPVKPGFACRGCAYKLLCPEYEVALGMRE